MPFDAGLVRAITHEINETLAGGAKVERITQTGRDEFLFHLHAGGVTRRLCFRAGGDVPHFSYTAVERENMPTPSMFCMFLRKHLQGSKLVEASTPDFERVARFVFSCRDEMGFGRSRVLVAEMMGKYSNLILLDGEEKILSAFRIVDFSASRIRQVLPGMAYQPVPKQEKLDPLSLDRASFFASLAERGELALQKFITETYCGIAGRNAKELSRRVSPIEGVKASSVDGEHLFSVVETWFSKLKAHEYTPTLLLSPEGAPVDYSYESLAADGLETRAFSSPSMALDAFFGEKDREQNRLRRIGELSAFLKRKLASIKKTLALRREEMAAAEDGDSYKETADLITENIYRLKRGMESFVCIDYRKDPPVERKITLDTRLSPADNAQRLYRLYTKSRRAREKLSELILASEEELAYLESVESFLARAEGEADFSDLRAELEAGGYLAPPKRGGKPGKRDKRTEHKARPLEFTTSGGYRVLCGRNNLENDILTHRIADKDDIWFHAKDVGGSHVILLASGEEPPAEDYTEAAMIAARHCGAGDGSAPVAVDYTRVRYVKKPTGGRPGFVTYKNYSTAYVTPNKEEQ